jgi:hypothetical protein
MLKFVTFLATPLAMLAATPAAAQIFWKAPDVSGLPLLGYEPDMGVPLPGATMAEQKAAIIWNMRSGLNVAALQCGFEPTLRTVENYNAMLTNHGTELNAAFATLAAYFKRTNKVVKAGQNALDKFGTRTYSGYSTVNAQLNFCSTAGRLGRTALFTPRGQFNVFAQNYLRELRNSLRYQTEQQFRVYRLTTNGLTLPLMEDRCWKRDRYDTRCGMTRLP